MALRDYARLPDLMSTPELDAAVHRLLVQAGREAPTDVAEAMFELVLRAGRNAEPLSVETHADIDAWFQSAWSVTADDVLLDILLSVLVNLPLPGALATVRATRTSAEGRNAQLISAALAELGD